MTRFEDEYPHLIHDNWHILAERRRHWTIQSWTGDKYSGVAFHGTGHRCSFERNADFPVINVKLERAVHDYKPQLLGELIIFLELGVWGERLPVVLYSTDYREAPDWVKRPKFACSDDWPLSDRRSGPVSLSSLSRLHCLLTLQDGDLSEVARNMVTNEWRCIDDAWMFHKSGYDVHLKNVDPRVEKMYLSPEPICTSNERNKVQIARLTGTRQNESPLGWDVPYAGTVEVYARERQRCAFYFAQEWANLKQLALHGCALHRQAGSGEITFHP